MQDKNGICTIQNVKCEIKMQIWDARCEIGKDEPTILLATLGLATSLPGASCQKKNRALSAFKMADGEATSAADNIWLISYVAAYFPLCFVSIHAVMENEVACTYQYTDV